MANQNKRIVDLPLILSGDVSSLDVLPIVNVEADVTNKITIQQLSALFSSDNNYYLTAGTYNSITESIDFNGNNPATNFSVDVSSLVDDTGLTAVTFNTQTDTITLSSSNGSNLSALIPRYNRWFIPSGQTYTVENNFQSFVYGDLVVEGTLDLEPEGQLVVLNGNIILSGGSIIGSGTTYLIDLPEYNVFVTGGTYNNGTKSIDFNGNNGFTPFSVDLTELTFTGNTSGDCISDIFVSNIHSCSPLNINPNGEGNVIFGNSLTGVTIDVINSKTITSDLVISTTPLISNSLPNVLVRDSDGTIRLRDASTIGTVNYANVWFVDNVNGNNNTGQINNFTKPFATIEWLIGEGQSVLPSYNINDRALIYVRKGIYFPTSLNFYGWLYLRDYVDIYFEPGVELRGNFTFLDNNSYFVNPGTNAVNCNIYGEAIFDNTSSFVNNPGIIIKGPGSNVNIQCKQIKTRGFALGVSNSTTKSSVFIDCEEIYADTVGFAFVFSTRDRANVKINVRKKIYGPHRIFYFRNYFDGSFIVNTPETILTSGFYGNQFKQTLIVEGSTNGAEIEINTNFKNESNSTAGGASATIYTNKSFTGQCGAKIRINGDIVNNWDKSFWLQGPTDFVYRGIAKSLLGNVITDSGSKCTFLNSFISKTKDTIDGTSYNNYNFWLETASTTYFINSQLYNNLSGSTVLWLNTNNNNLYLYNSQLIINNDSGFSIDSTSLGNNLVCNNVITNVPYNNIVEATTISATTVDIKYKLPSI